MSRIAALILVVAGACNGGDDGVTHLDGNPGSGHDATGDGNGGIDAPPGGTTSCANPIATSATPEAVISGVLNDSAFSASGQPLVGATIAAYRGASSLGSTLTQSGGIYQITATTGGQPIEYLQASDTGYTTERYYPRAPLAKASSMPKFPLFTTADAAGFPAQFGVTQDGAKGVAVVFVFDCQSSPISNATITVSPAGSAVVKYLHSDNSTTGTATDGLGVAVVFNLGTGATTINAMKSGLMMHEHVIAPSPSYLTLAAISEQ